MTFTLQRVLDSAEVGAAILSMHISSNSASHNQPCPAPEHTVDRFGENPVNLHRDLVGETRR
jgi:hypothetical protein